MGKSHAFPPLTPTAVLGVAAHSDDLDFMAAATMALFVRGGAKVHYLILTDGSAGSDDPNMARHDLVELRRSEQDAAARALGLASVTFADFVDGTLENSMAVKKEVVRQ